MCMYIADLLISKFKCLPLLLILYSEFDINIVNAVRLEATGLHVHASCVVIIQILAQRHIITA